MPKPTGSSLERARATHGMFLDVAPVAEARGVSQRSESDQVGDESRRQAFAQIDGDLFSAKVERAAEALGAASRTNTVAWAAFTNEQREFYRVKNGASARYGRAHGGRTVTPTNEKLLALLRNAAKSSATLSRSPLKRFRCGRRVRAAPRRAAAAIEEDLRRDAEGSDAAPHRESRPCRTVSRTGMLTCGLSISPVRRCSTGPS